MTHEDKPTSAQNENELFDVVDENDNVLGRLTRREVHAGGYRHRAVHVLVFGSDGRLFLQKRSMAKDSSPGLWDASCSGHVDAGESYDAAACRELAEEIGLQLPKAPARWFYILACAETGNEFVWVYQCIAEGPFTLNRAEIECGKWYVPADLTNEISNEPHRFTRPFRHIWQKACGLDGTLG